MYWRDLALTSGFNLLTCFLSSFLIDLKLNIQSQTSVPPAELACGKLKGAPNIQKRTNCWRWDGVSWPGTFEQVLTQTKYLALSFSLALWICYLKICCSSCCAGFFFISVNVSALMDLSRKSICSFLSVWQLLIVFWQITGFHLSTLAFIKMTSISSGFVGI